MNKLGNFKFLIGFFILGILILGLYSMTMLTLMADPDRPRTGGVGGQEPGGRSTIAQLIDKYDLDRDEFLTAIKLPLDYNINDGEQIIAKVRRGELSQKDIRDYMAPIMDEYAQKQKEEKSK